jgi:hypothetical protein
MPAGFRSRYAITHQDARNGTQLNTGCSAISSLNWAGVPLRPFETVITYNEGTETVTGLQVRADLKRGGNEIGERVSNEEMRSLSIEAHAICPAWS